MEKFEGNVVKKTSAKIGVLTVFAIAVVKARGTLDWNACKHGAQGNDLSDRVLEGGII